MSQVVHKELCECFMWRPGERVLLRARHCECLLPGPLLTVSFTLGTESCPSQRPAHTLCLLHLLCPSPMCNSQLARLPTSKAAKMEGPLSSAWGERGKPAAFSLQPGTHSLDYDANLVEVSGGWEEKGGTALHCHLLVGAH